MTVEQRGKILDEALVVIMQTLQGLANGTKRVEVIRNLKYTTFDTEFDDTRLTAEITTYQIVDA